MPEHRREKPPVEPRFLLSLPVETHPGVRFETIRAGGDTLYREFAESLAEFGDIPPAGVVSEPLLGGLDLWIGEDVTVEMESEIDDARDSLDIRPDRDVFACHVRIERGEFTRLEQRLDAAVDP